MEIYKTRKVRSRRIKHPSNVDFISLCNGMCTTSTFGDSFILGPLTGNIHPSPTKLGFLCPACVPLAWLGLSNASEAWASHSQKHSETWKNGKNHVNLRSWASVKALTPKKLHCHVVFENRITQPCCITCCHTSKIHSYPFCTDWQSQRQHREFRTNSFSFSGCFPKQVGHNSRCSHLSEPQLRVSGG